MHAPLEIVCPLTYNRPMNRQILPSALIHGFSEDDILYAMDHAIVSFEYEGNYLIILAYIGPAENSVLIEVFSNLDANGDEMIFHAMKLSKSVALAAQKYLEETS